MVGDLRRPIGWTQSPEIQRLRRWGPARSSARPMLLSVTPLFQPLQISAFSKSDDPGRLIRAIFASSIFRVVRASMLR